MIIYQCTPTRRIVQHNDEHYDIETLFTINPQPGVVEQVWAVIECGITGEDEMEYTRCEEGQRLAKEYVSNYNKVLKEGGDWMEAFADTRVHDHTETCAQCQNYIAARRTGFIEPTPKGSELKFGNVVFDLDAMGENARQRSEALKARIVKRRVEAQARRRADIERVRKAER